MKRSALKQTAKAVYTFDGENLNMLVDMDAITPAFMKQVAADAASGDPESLSRLLAEVIESWDLEDDDGNQLPADFETINTLGLGHLKRIQDVIDGMVDQDLDLEGKASDSSLSPAAPSENPPTGT